MTKIYEHTTSFTVLTTHKIPFSNFPIYNNPANSCSNPNWQASYKHLKTQNWVIIYLLEARHNVTSDGADQSCDVVHEAFWETVLPGWL